jgi:hypothetical protein
MDSVQIWEVTLFKNVGTLENPIMEWVTENRHYFCEKKDTDSDLHDILGLRKNAHLIEPKQLPE